MELHEEVWGFKHIKGAPLYISKKKNVGRNLWRRPTTHSSCSHRQPLAHQSPGLVVSVRTHEVERTEPNVKSVHRGFVTLPDQKMFFQRVGSETARERDRETERGICLLFSTPCSPSLSPVSGFYSSLFIHICNVLGTVVQQHFLKIHIHILNAN